MAVSNLVAASSGLTTARFPARIGAPFNIPAGLTLQNTITSSTSFAAGALPAQVWVVLIGGGGGGCNGGTSTPGAGGGGGGACIGWVDIPSGSTTYAVIGAGGTGSAGGSSVNLPGRGGDTTFAGHIAFGGGVGFGGSGATQWYQTTVSPRGPGAGMGGTPFSIAAANSLAVPENCAPLTVSKNGVAMFNTQTTTAYSAPNTGVSVPADYNNFTGGGAGYNGYNQNGGDGLTGGGCGGSTGASWRGGNSSRDGGSTFTFTGATTTNANGAGGAGFLANGSGSNGGSGGGGGAGQYNTNVGGNGGAGCILIYY